MARIKEKLADLIKSANLQKYWFDNISNYPNNKFKSFEEFESSITSNANIQDITLRTVRSVMDSERVGQCNGLGGRSC
jgi:hypothetical protein